MRTLNPNQLSFCVSELHSGQRARYCLHQPPIDVEIDVAGGNEGYASRAGHPVNHRLDHDHPDRKAPHPSLPSGFRVMDVDKKRIVEMPDQPILLTTGSTFSSYPQIGGENTREMPKTIEDAIEALCRNRGIVLVG
ncbi:hypothetical protein PTI98_012077 [Pleurotus ostreatus]|nr:hypothetical protein PTI98_012077 [Pleurotus ostreatus]